MTTRRTFVRTLPVAFTSACQALHAKPSEPGPGMILTYIGLRDGLRAQVLSITLPDGTHWGSPGGIGGKWHKNWKQAPGATSGASGDHRNLPEWVDFVWFDTVYNRAVPYTKAEMDTIARQTQRVPVRSRVPQDVVQQAIVARQQAPANKVPETMLWLYFVWTDGGIKFYWELRRGSETLREGGDNMDAK